MARRTNEPRSSLRPSSLVSSSTSYQRMSSGALGMLSFSLDVLKPRYSEAVARLKNSLMALFALVVLTHLLPVPPLYSALWRVYRGSYRSFPHKVISLSGEPSPCLQWTDLISFNCASLCRILGIFHFGVQYPPSILRHLLPSKTACTSTHSCKTSFHTSVTTRHFFSTSLAI